MYFEYEGFVSWGGGRESWQGCCEEAEEGQGGGAGSLSCGIVFCHGDRLYVHLYEQIKVEKMNEFHTCKIKIKC